LQDRFQRQWQNAPAAQRKEREWSNRQHADDVSDPVAQRRSDKFFARQESGRDHQSDIACRHKSRAHGRRQNELRKIAHRREPRIKAGFRSGQNKSAAE
jgi:hypothetical protein